MKQQIDGGNGQGFSVYCELFSDDFLYLELQGFPFEVTSTAGPAGQGPGTVVIRLPNEWARKIGLLNESESGKS